MTFAPIARPAFVGPKHVTGGVWRRAVEVAAVVAVCIPLVSWTWLVVWSLFTGRPLAVVVVVLEAVALFGLWSHGRRYVRWAMWRARWWADARAGGLALNAEHGLIGTDTGSFDAVHSVVVPWVHRIVLTPNGRRYVIRPLPGQSFDDFQAAVPRLVQRWAAVSVTVEQQPGSRYVVLTVANAMPKVTRYKAAA